MNNRPLLLINTLEYRVYGLINSLPIYWEIFMLVDFFKIDFFEKKKSGLPSEWQKVWIHLRPKMSGLIWVQLFAKAINDYISSTIFLSAGS